MVKEEYVDTISKRITSSIPYMELEETASTNLTILTCSSEKVDGRWFAKTLSFQSFLFSKNQLWYAKEERKDMHSIA